jgi:hypothetical protein
VPSHKFHISNFSPHHVSLLTLHRRNKLDTYLMHLVAACVSYFSDTSVTRLVASRHVLTQLVSTSRYVSCHLAFYAVTTTIHHLIQAQHTGVHSEQPATFLRRHSLAASLRSARSLSWRAVLLCPRRPRPGGAGRCSLLLTAGRRGQIPAREREGEQRSTNCSSALR